MTQWFSVVVQLTRWFSVVVQLYVFAIFSSDAREKARAQRTRLLHASYTSLTRLRGVYEACLSDIREKQRYNTPSSLVRQHALQV
jgi:hypothetical protein